MSGSRECSVTERERMQAFRKEANVVKSIWQGLKRAVSHGVDPKSTTLGLQTGKFWTSNLGQNVGATGLVATGLGTAAAAGSTLLGSTKKHHDAMTRPVPRQTTMYPGKF